MFYKSCNFEKSRNNMKVTIELNDCIIDAIAQTQANDVTLS